MDIGLVRLHLLLAGLTPFRRPRLVRSAPHGCGDRSSAPTIVVAMRVPPHGCGDVLDDPHGGD
jgi:hypothetical protein